MDEQEFINRASAMERRLYRVCASILSSDADSADAVQEALLKAWRARASLKHDEYFETWLTRIVINECKQFMRRRRPALALDERIQAPDPPDTALRDALNSLEDALRLPVTLHYINGFDLESVARILRIPSGTVKSRLYRARAKLKKLLNEEERTMKKADKRSVVMVAAICAALLIGGIALAASVGVFHWAAERTGDENRKRRFERVNALADGETQTWTSADGAIRLEVGQSFFTGGELYVGYRLIGQTQRLTDAFEPDAELLARIKASGLAGQAALSDPALRSAVEALSKRTYGDGEYGCAAYDTYYLDDHKALVVNGEAYDVCPAEQDEERVGDVTTGYFVLGGEVGKDECAMPAIDESADAVSLEMTLRHGRQYCYQDASGLYVYGEPVGDGERMGFSVRFGEMPTRTGRAERAYDDYAVRVEIEANDVATRARVVIRFPQDGVLTNRWENEDQLRSAGKDALGYYAMIIDGVVYEGYEGEHDASEGENVVAVQNYVFPGVGENVTEIILRPRYILAGADSRKDIAIPLAK